MAAIGLLAAIGAACCTVQTATAMPVAPLGDAPAAALQDVRWVCGPYRCWWRPSYYG